ncbi:acyltransferase family protein [Streptomyces sp. NRRL S-350]|uniref:acyltransferase family protein n=1 Tax=Streptomyces sp. NRRL S-350 TaxID=1463902 RepID=UPI00068B85F6|nr:acyltransferase [Streptomyces sp. NRRL S-350]
MKLQSPARPRLGWLDALRGLAALAVALHHFGLLDKIPHGSKVPKYLDLGFFGVMLFFLVSGYVIPASLERRGDVRAFWLGRFFRIHPAVVVTVGASLLVLPRSSTAVQDFSFDHPLLSTAANGLMLQDLMGVPSSIGVMWSLTYEMVFYYFVTALFVLGWHRHSAPVTVGFAAVALVLGAWLPLGAITVDLASTRHLVTAGAVLVVTAMACIATGRPEPTRWGSLLLGGLGLALVTLNSRAAGFETMMIFATMFAGTVLYRLEHGRIDRLPALLCCSFVVVCGVAVGYLYDHGTALWHTWTASWTAFSLTYLAAWAVFAGGMLLRHRRFPRWLSGLGTISFSVYLLHGPLMHLIGWKLRGHSPIVGWKGQAALTAGFLAALVVLGYLGYRLVEIPFQNLGRRAAKALDRRFPATAAVPAERIPLASRV